MTDYLVAMGWMLVVAFGIILMAIVLNIVRYIINRFEVHILKMQQEAEWARFNNGWDKHKKRMSEGFHDGIMRTR